MSIKPVKYYIHISSAAVHGHHPGGKRLIHEIERHEYGHRVHINKGDAVVNVLTGTQFNPTRHRFSSSEGSLFQTAMTVASVYERMTND